MLEIHKGRFCRSYENSFFREFTESLENFFLARKLKGLLLGSPSCESDPSLQMDVLLITPGAICVIDFKNYFGTVTLPASDDFDQEQWIINHGGRVKGGSNNKNPFRQLALQKKKLAAVIRDRIGPKLTSPEVIDPRFIKRVVCFQGRVMLEGDIPGRESRDFAIADRSNFLEVIGDLVDVETQEIILKDNGFHHFNQVFKTVDASEYLTDTELYNSFNNLVQGLTPDQQTVLKHFDEWLAQPGQQIFILQGTSNSGKSHLIPYLRTCTALASPANVLNLARNKRVANYLNGMEPLADWQSLYAHIYDLDESDNADDREPDQEPPGQASGESGGEAPGEEEAARLEVVPLKESHDDRDMVYFVDEAQLVTNNLIQNDLLRFGSGQLLNDFLEFADLESTDRKIVFIGDSFQHVTQGYSLTAVRLGNSPLIPEDRLADFSLRDKPGHSQLTREFLKFVDAILFRRFSNLSLEDGEALVRITRGGFLAALNREALASNRQHILTLQRRSAKQINLRIKEEVLGTGRELAAGDLIVLYNSVEAHCQKDAAYQTKYLPAWTFARVVEAGPEDEPRFQKAKEITVGIRTRKLVIQLLQGDDMTFTVFSLENFRERGKETADEQKAIRILMEKEKRKALTARPFSESAECRELLQNELIIRLKGKDGVFIENLVAGKRVKSELSEEETEARELVRKAKREYRAWAARLLKADPDSEYFKLKNLARVDYGWAFTVHKAAPLKWEEVILIDDYYNNKSSEDYFRLIYTGLSRATAKASIVDFERMSPWQRTLFADNSRSNADPPGLMLVDAEAADRIVAAILKTLKGVAGVAGLETVNIRENNYHLLFTLSRGNESAQVRIFYNLRGEVKDPVVDRASSEEFAGMIKKAFLAAPGLRDLSFPGDYWRAEEYERLAAELKDRGLTLMGVKQNQFQDRLLFASPRGKLLVQIAYTGTSAFSRATALFRDDPADWEAFQAVARGLEPGMAEAELVEVLRRNQTAKNGG